MNQIFLGQPSDYIKNWFITKFPTWPTYTTLKFKNGTTQTKEIYGIATWRNIGVKSEEQSIDDALTYCQLGKNVTEISSYAFYNCLSLYLISIPNSVTSIGYFAFDSCASLSSISIPSSVTSIGEWAFYDCSSLTSVIFEGRTSDQITSMANYPWDIPNPSVIKGSLS